MSPFLLLLVSCFSSYSYSYSCFCCFWCEHGAKPSAPCPAVGWLLPQQLSGDVHRNGFICVLYTHGQFQTLWPLLGKVGMGQCPQNNEQCILWREKHSYFSIRLNGLFFSWFGIQCFGLINGACLVSLSVHERTIAITYRCCLLLRSWVQGKSLLSCMQS